mmetsp:Transcript_91668/g.255249  ORF Transcript_91668/g.255249 Transcript_91668/m.255249 type:complete len:247 (-) Transcript_91668:71-811(-)
MLLGVRGLADEVRQRGPRCRRVQRELHDLVDLRRGEVVRRQPRTGGRQVLRVHGLPDIRRHLHRGCGHDEGPVHVAIEGGRSRRDAQSRRRRLRTGHRRRGARRDGHAHGPRARELRRRGLHADRRRHERGPARDEAVQEGRRAKLPHRPRPAVQPLDRRLLAHGLSAVGPMLAPRCRRSRGRCRHERGRPPRTRQPKTRQIHASAGVSDRAAARRVHSPATVRTPEGERGGAPAAPRRRHEEMIF